MDYYHAGGKSPLWYFVGLRYTVTRHVHVISGFSGGVSVDVISIVWF